MKVLITGSKGQLGQALIEKKPENIDLILNEYCGALQPSREKFFFDNLLSVNLLKIFLIFF